MKLIKLTRTHNRGPVYINALYITAVHKNDYDDQHAIVYTTDGVYDVLESLETVMKIIEDSTQFPWAQIYPARY